MRFLSFWPSTGKGKRGAGKAAPEGCTNGNSSEKGGFKMTSLKITDGRNR